MFGHNFPKLKLIVNLRLDILLKMLIYYTYYILVKEIKKSLTRGHVKDIGFTVGIQFYP